MKRVHLLIIPILLACFLVAGCAQLGIGTLSDPTKMTGKQFATFAMGVYTRQYADYKTQIALPNRTPEVNKVLALRKEILIKAWPLISMYDLSIASGQPQDKTQEAAIMALLNQIGTLIIKK